MSHEPGVKAISLTSTRVGPMDAWKGLCFLGFDPCL